MCADERFHQLTKLTFYQRFPMKITMMIMYFVITVDKSNEGPTGVPKTGVPPTYVPNNFVIGDNGTHWVRQWYPSYILDWI